MNSRNSHRIPQIGRSHVIHRPKHLSDFIHEQKKPKLLNVKTVLFQTIQFSISTQFSSIWPRDRMLSGATTPGQSGPGSDSNEGVLHILQSCSITRVSPSDCLLSYSGNSLGVVLPLCREAVSVFYSSSWLGNSRKKS